MSKTTHRRGFTLIETLMAVLLLTVSIGGPLTIAARGLLATLVAKDQSTGFFLAQDALEHIQFKRDSNRLAGNGWLDGLESCTSSDGSNVCTVETLSDTVSACSGTCPLLNYDSDSANGGNYTYSGGTPSIFRRSITITNPVNGNVDEAQVEVRVTWSDIAGTELDVILRENFLNWQ